jgi:AcrR family transcriptional regulator
MGAYRSQLRADQVESTRDRILDATIAVIGEGVTELSIPAVARSAKVSVPTVYRHFKSKRGLVKALGERLRLQSAPAHTDAHSPSELADFVRGAYEHHVALPEVVRAATRSELRRQIDRDTGGQDYRAAWVRRAFASVIKGLPAKERDHLLRMVYVMCSSAQLRAFQEHFGSTPQEAAETVGWAVRALGEYARARSNEKKTRKTR